MQGRYKLIKGYTQCGSHLLRLKDTGFMATRLVAGNMRLFQATFLGQFLLRQTRSESKGSECRGALINRVGHPSPSCGDLRFGCRILRINVVVNRKLLLRARNGEVVRPQVVDLQWLRIERYDFTQSRMSAEDFR